MNGLQLLFFNFRRRLCFIAESIQEGHCSFLIHLNVPLIVRHHGNNGADLAIVGAARFDDPNLLF